jgi:hypothetical protein
MIGVNLNDSVFRVTSKGPDDRRFGTSFAIHQEEQATFLLTCRHVVTDAGGVNAIRIGNQPVEIVASGSEDSLDLAVLRVKDLRNVPILRLDASGMTGRLIRVIGFQELGEGYVLRDIRGKLGAQVGLESKTLPDRIQAWDLSIEDDFGLQRGYSGAPVIDEESGDVMAVSSLRIGEKKGVAISVENLQEIWPGMLPRIQRTYLVNVFCRELFRVSDLTPVEPDILKLYHISQKVKFSNIAVARNARRKPISRIMAVIEADGLSQNDIRLLHSKYRECVRYLMPDLGFRYAHLIFLFKKGLPDEMLVFIRLMNLSKPEPSKPEPPDKKRANLSEIARNLAKEMWEDFTSTKEPQVYISNIIIDFKEGLVDIPGPLQNRTFRPRLEPLVKDFKARYTL